MAIIKLMILNMITMAITLVMLFTMKMLIILMMIIMIILLVNQDRKKTHKHKLFGRPAGGSGPKCVRMKLWRFPGVFSRYLRGKTMKSKDKCQKKVREQNRKKTSLCRFCLCVFFSSYNNGKISRRTGRTYRDETRLRTEKST